MQTTQLRDLRLDTPPVELMVLSACRTAVDDRSIPLPIPHEVDRLVPDGNLSHPYFWSGFTAIGTPW